MPSLPPEPVKRWSVTLLVLGLLLAALVLVLAGQGSAAEPGCVALEVQISRGAPVSLISTVDLTSGQRSVLGKIRYPVNAIGYDGQQILIYGIVGWPRVRLIRINKDGISIDVGPVRGGGRGLTDAVAGAVIGDELAVGAGNLLYQIGINPANSDFDVVSRVVPLQPAWLANGIDDFALDPANGLLYGIRANWFGPPSVVTIAPGTGSVSEIRVVRDLPRAARYGSIILSGQVLYAVANDVLGRSRLYRIPLSRSDAAIEVASWPAAESTDMAGCLATDAVTPTTPSSSSAEQTKPSGSARSGTVQPATSGSSLPVPRVLRAPTSTVHLAPPTTAAPLSSAVVASAAPSSPPPSPSPSPTNLPRAESLTQPSGRERDTERRWALATAVLVFGGAAVSARTAVVRSRRQR